MAEADADGTIIFLMGPTAGGKTALAVALRERLPVELVSVDSAMVYRGMDIGTAKPGPELLSKAPHRLIDICDPAESYSAARFRSDALAAIDAIRASGRIPLLTGGTGLYFRALEQGLSKLPGADPALRSRLSARLRQQGAAALHKTLAEVDPASAQRLHPNDTQRVQRALEVYEITGIPYSEALNTGRAAPSPHRIIKLAAAPAQRNVIHTRVAQRFDRMLDAGLVAETQALYERPDLHAGLSAMRLVGYRQVWQHLAGRLNYEAMRTRAIIATRQLAKRQFTWLRRERELTWFDSSKPDITDTILRFLQTHIR